MSKPDERISSFTDFYPYYLTEHSDPDCRKLHFVGTFLSILALIAAIFVHPAWIIAAPFAGYSFAWFAHFKIEKNRPATFTYPVWSLISDYKMFFSWLVGKLPEQLIAAGVVDAPVDQASET